MIEAMRTRLNVYHMHFIWFCKSRKNYIGFSSIDLFWKEFNSRREDLTLCLQPSPKTEALLATIQCLEGRKNKLALREQLTMGVVTNLGKVLLKY